MLDEIYSSSLNALGQVFDKAEQAISKPCYRSSYYFHLLGISGPKSSRQRSLLPQQTLSLEVELS
jgi:hypothetical protein